MARADHIYVSRGAYTHQGIDAGDGTVIHFSGEPGTAKFNAAIERTSMDDFLKGGEIKIRRYGKRDDADTTMRRAESRIGDKDYHLVINNCEHFATWCCTGRNSSQQVRGAGSLTAHGAVAGTTLPRRLAWSERWGPLADSAVPASCRASRPRVAWSAEVRLSDRP